MTASALANNLPVLTSTWDSSLSNSAMPTGTQFANGFVDNVDNITAEAYNYLHGASTGLVWLGQLLGLAQPFNPDVSGNSKVAVPSGGIVTLKNSVSGATEWYVALNSRSTGFTDPSLDVTNWTLINFAVLAKSPPVYADNTGTSEALLAVYVNVAYPVLVDGFPVTVGIVTPNTGNTVTLQVNLNGSLKNADSCVKFINNIAYPLVPGDLQGDSMFARDAPNTRWVLQNPADTTKPGETIEWTGPTAPTGYLQCPVAQTLVSTTTYAALFAAIGYTWGGAGGSFGLPFYPAGFTDVTRQHFGTDTARIFGTKPLAWEFCLENDFA